MQEEKHTQSNSTEPENKPLSETISNAHSSGDGAIRLSEDGLVEPSGETPADADAQKERETKPDAY